MNRKIIFSILALLFLWSNHSASAQLPVIIRGTLPGAEGKEIHLMMASEFLTGEKQSVCKNRISKEGTFSLEAIIKTITPVTLSIDFYTFTFFIVPGEQYILSAKNMVFNDAINPFILKPQLPLTFEQLDPLNKFIMQFNEGKYSLEQKKYREIFQSQDGSIFDALFLPIDSLPIKYQFFCEQYQIYSIGALKASYSKKRTARLAGYYLYKTDTDITDYCFMLFFNAFFDEYIPEHCNDISFSELHVAMYQNPTVAAVSNILKNDPVLANEEVRLLFLIKMLDDYSFPSNIVTKLLKDLQSSDYSVQIKEASKIVMSKINRLLPKSDAPSFAFRSVSGTIVKSSDFNKKYLYINFFKTNCYDCILAMEQMRNLYAKHNVFFEFISICIDNKEETFLEFSQKNIYPWTVLYAGYNQDAISEWQAFMLPYYILLNDNYKIISCPALAPEENIQFVMEKISWEAQRRQRQKK